MQVDIVYTSVYGRKRTVVAGCFIGISRCRGIGPPSGIPSSGLCFCWLPIDVVIQLLQRSASPRARLTSNLPALLSNTWFARKARRAPPGAPCRIHAPATGGPGWRPSVGLFRRRRAPPRGFLPLARRAGWGINPLARRAPHWLGERARRPVRLAESARPPPAGARVNP